LDAVQHSVLSRMYSLWETVRPISDYAEEDIRTFRTCRIDFLVDEQLKKGLGDVKPEPVGFPIPWKVLEVNLIYDASVSVRSGFGRR